jgi:ATP-dependent Lhr-like helicase
VQLVSSEERAERWAWLLLNRYGVMCRDLLARESLAPSWRELVSVYRRLEMRGEIRGGRFLAGVAGEQYALSNSVERLRKTRDKPAEQTLQVISAADPLNLIGIVTRDARVPATRSNRVLLSNGRPIAANESRTIRWLSEVDDATRQRATQLLLGPDALRCQEIAAQSWEAVLSAGVTSPHNGESM